MDKNAGGNFSYEEFNFDRILCNKNQDKRCPRHEKKKKKKKIPHKKRRIGITQRL